MSLDALAVTTDEARQGIDARLLHAALGVGRDFSNWMKDQVDRFDLMQGRDFEVFATSGENPQGGRPSTEYTLSLSTAELIAISMRTPEAARAREALVRIKESWNSPTAVMARAVVMAHAEIQRHRHAEEVALAEAAQLRPKAEAFDRLAGAGGDISIRKTAKTLGIPERELVARLLRDAILFRDARGRLEPYAQHIQTGRFRVRSVVIGDHDEDVTTQALVTPAGLVWLDARYVRPTVALAPRLPGQSEASH